MSDRPSSPTALASERYEDILEAYRKDALLQGLQEGTLDTYLSNIGYLLDWLDDDPRTIDRDDLKNFLYHLRNEREGRGPGTGLRPSTLNSYFSAITSFYDYLAYEGEIQRNPVPEIRDRYLNLEDDSAPDKQLLSVEEMATLFHGTLDVRNRAIIVLLAKTGIRRGELISIDHDHIDWDEQSIRLRDTPKQSNTLVFFDGEWHQVLERWVKAKTEVKPSTDALFTNQSGDRLKRHGVYAAVTNAAEAVGFHDPDSSDPQDRFTPHCCRHWFTTHLRRAGMQRAYIQELRGDSRRDAINLYDHIDREELRESYLAHISSLGI